MPILAILGVPVVDNWPPYCSSLALEVWELPQTERRGHDGLGGRHVSYPGDMVVRVLFNQEVLCLPGVPEGNQAVLPVLPGVIIFVLFRFCCFFAF